MLKFANLDHSCIFCHKKLPPVKAICKKVDDYEDLFELEFINSHKICKRYEIEQSFLKNEIDLLQKSLEQKMMRWNVIQKRKLVKQNNAVWTEIYDNNVK
jgi:hypothetical protein